jgi:hypothetical protein
MLSGLPAPRSASSEPISYQLQPQPAADEGCSALQGFDGHIAFHVQDAIELRAAFVHALGEFGLGDALTLHFLFQLPSDNARQRFGLCRFANALLGEKAVESGSPMGILLHARISFIRRRARSRSCPGVFCVS